MFQAIFGFFYSNKSIENFSERLSFAKKGMNFQKWLKQGILASFVFFIVLGALALELNADAFAFPAIFILSFCFGLLLNYSVWDYLIEKRKREIESLVPEVLLSASIFSSHSPMIELIEFVSENDFTHLSIEFKKALNEIHKGESIQNALRNISFRVKSETVERAINLMVWGYESGSKLNSLFREAAEEILELKAIESERNATMLIEKYTLLAAGGILVPLILGLIVNMISGLNFPSEAMLSIGTDVVKRKELLEAALIANQVYIAEYALLASLFVSIAEGNPKKTVIYGAVLLPLSLAIFYAVQWIF